MYGRMLKDIPLDVVTAAVYGLIKRSRFMPSIADITEECAEISLRLPREAEALAQLEARMAWGREREGEPPEIHPLVRTALEHVGGYHAFRSTDNPAVVRGQFLKLYRDLRGSTIRDYQTAPAPQLEQAFPLLSPNRQVS